MLSSVKLMRVRIRKLLLDVTINISCNVRARYLPIIREMTSLDKKPNDRFDTPILRGLVKEV